jgi:hypothetical protein
MQIGAFDPACGRTNSGDRGMNISTSGGFGKEGYGFVSTGLKNAVDGIVQQEGSAFLWERLSASIVAAGKPLPQKNYRSPAMGFRDVSNLNSGYTAG